MTPLPSKSFPAFASAIGHARFVAAYDAVLEDWPVPFEELEVPTQSGVTHVIASGPLGAPPLILLPSFSGTATVWRLNMEGLSRHFRCYAVDVIGQPGKSTTPRDALDRQQFAAWLTGLLDGLAVPRVSLVGCSFGGYLALSQAALTPDRVERVVVISPVGVFQSQFLKLIYAMVIKGTIRKLMRRLTGSRRAPSMADLGIVPNDEKWGKLMSVTMAEAPRLSKIRPARFRSAEIEAIRTPTLILVGDQERLYDPQRMLAMAQRLMPHAQGEIVSNADHLAAMAQPAEVNARITDFLLSSVHRSTQLRLATHSVRRQP